MARLIDLHWQSRTVHVKIRYEGFITESAQETGEPIKGFTELYSRVIKLFRNKYKPQHGVRLVGAGLMNIETSPAPEEKGLFDEESTVSEKEIALEKLVVELNKKFPCALKRGRAMIGGE
jgi:DNA polymerase-4